MPDIASFFNITVDDLLGINKAKTEEKLSALIEEYDNLSDPGQTRKEMLNKMKQVSSNDFRVLLRELGYLVHFCDVSENGTRIKSIYDNIRKNCNVDRIRICAARHIIIYYAELSKRADSLVPFSDVEKMLEDMPYMRDGQEFISAYLYQKGHPEYYSKIQEAIEQSIGLADTAVSHYYLYDDSFSVDYKIEMLGRILDIKNMIYDDGNYGEQWLQVIYNHGSLGYLFFQKGDKKTALIFLKKCAELALQYDRMDRFTEMNSMLFKGRVFDKNKLGTPFSAAARMRYLFEEKYPLSDDFKQTEAFRSVMDILQ
ncbi:MAG: hypothetical protein MJ168_03145 [Clostridia bacterium]|nr:hypothetical protein [Clostridia bacterium]